MRERWARLTPMLAPEDGTDAAGTATEPPQAASAPPAPDAGKLRDLVLAANPGVIAEMVAGNTLDELLASVTPAKAAYDRIVASVQDLQAGNPAASPPAIPAGGGSARQFVVNIEELSASAKITEGLRQRRARS